MKVYGPYTASCGRRDIVILVYGDGSRKTMSYARYLMQEHLGRTLDKCEEVDHIDGNPKNNELANLQLLGHQENTKKSKPTEVIEVVCPECGNIFEAKARYIRHNQVNYKKKGPFCSKQCAGRYNQRAGR